MAEHLSPLPYLADLAEFFTEGAAAGGLTIDAELCRDFSAGIVEVSEIAASLLTLCEAHGLIGRTVLAVDRPRTPAERRALAAEANAVAFGTVVRFPIAPCRHVAISEGGSAA